MGIELVILSLVHLLGCGIRALTMPSPYRPGNDLQHPRCTTAHVRNLASIGPCVHARCNRISAWQGGPTAVSMLHGKIFPTMANHNPKTSPRKISRRLFTDPFIVQYF